MALGTLGRLYEDGQVIIRQGDMSDNMFVIQEGQVEIIEEVGGKPVQLAIRKKGDLFGEMSLFERQGRSATVRAIGRTRVLSVDRDVLVHRLHDDPSMAYRMMTTMARRVRELSNELAELKESAPNTARNSAPNSQTES